MLLFWALDPQSQLPMGSTWRPIRTSNSHPNFPQVSYCFIPFSSVQFSCSVMSDFLWPHGLHHARLPYPSSTPRVYSDSCPSSRWYHPTISSSVIPFSSCLQSFPASGSFPMSQLFVSGGQSIGVSASTSVLPMNTQDWSPLEWTGWISLQSKGLSRVFSNTTAQKHQFFGAQLSLLFNSHIHTWLHSLTRQTFVGKVMSLLFNMLSRLVITFLPRSKHLLISWLQSPYAVILEPRKIKSDTVSPSISHEVMGPDAMILVFWMLSFKLTLFPENKTKTLIKFIEGNTIPFTFYYFISDGNIFFIFYLSIVCVCVHTNPSPLDIPYTPSFLPCALICLSQTIAILSLMFVLFPVF